MLGYPSVLPLKYTYNAKVVNDSNIKYFEADLDAFGGNSGSAVFNDDGEVTGILVRGYSDFVFDSRRGCNGLRYVPSGGARGEQITRSERWINLIPE